MRQILFWPAVADRTWYQRLAQSIRTSGISLTAGAMNWVNDHVVTKSPEINAVDELRWWLEDRLSDIFQLCWDGSDEEVRCVIDRETPEHFMTARQLAVLSSWPANYTSRCWSCSWYRWLDQDEYGLCPWCAQDSEVLRLEDRKELNTTLSGICDRCQEFSTSLTVLPGTEFTNCPCCLALGQQEQAVRKEEN